MDSIAMRNLLRAAQALGVSQDRILFAPRIHKLGHIVRQAAGDLFLDSFVYGAHSTATDALRAVKSCPTDDFLLFPLLICILFLE